MGGWSIYRILMMNVFLRVWWFVCNNSSELWHPDHSSCISVCPDSIFQQTFPRQPWQESDTLGRGSLTSGQRSIKGNLLFSERSNDPPIFKQPSSQHAFLKKAGELLLIHQWQIPSDAVFFHVLFLLYTDLLKCLLRWPFVTFPSNMCICDSGLFFYFIKLLYNTNSLLNQNRKGSFALNLLRGINASFPFFVTTALSSTF